MPRPHPDAPRPAAARSAASLALVLLLAAAQARAQAPDAPPSGVPAAGVPTPGAMSPDMTAPHGAPMDMAPVGPAANSTTLAITGRVARPSTLDLAALQALPQTTVSLDQAGEHGGRHATYRGVLVWTLLDAAGLVDEPGRKTFLRHTILARGQDGYAVALAIGELDPRFEGKQALVALSEDDRALPSLRLVLPGDHKAGRGVHDLAAFEVR